MAKAKTPEKPTIDPPAKPKSRKLMTALLVVAALALGGGAASAYFLIFGGGPKQAMAKAAEPKPAEIDIQDPMTFVDVQRLMVPLYEPDGKLQNYLSVDLALEVRSSQKEFVQQRLAKIRHAINLMASTTDLRNSANTERLDFERAAKLMLNRANVAISEPSTQAPVHSLSIVSAIPI